MSRRGLIAMLLCATASFPNALAHATVGGCGSLSTVDCGAGADPAAGDFHGMVAATNADWVLSLSAQSGTTPGCGDCEWRVALACPTSDPDHPNTCGGAPNPLACQPGQLLYRLYLSDAAVTDDVVGELCLGGPSHLVGIGDQARADVDRYLHDVTPPPLSLQVRPGRLTLAGLITQLRIGDLRRKPVGFGGPDVTETIKLQVVSTSVRWGDGIATGWRTGAPAALHRYLSAGTDRIQLTARWGATYTVQYDGQRFGPYDATGQLTAHQGRTERVATSSPVLVRG